MYLRICVIAYLCILHLIHGNVIFDILESHAFQKYSTCWVLSLSNLKNLKNLKKWILLLLDLTLINTRAPDGANNDIRTFPTCNNQEHRLSSQFPLCGHSSPDTIVSIAIFIFNLINVKRSLPRSNGCCRKCLTRSCNPSPDHLLCRDHHHCVEQ